MFAMPNAPVLRAGETERSWSYDIYYINQSDPHYVNKSDNFNLKYQMEFHTSIDIKPYDVQIRVPVSLVKYGHGEEHDGFPPS